MGHQKTELIKRTIAGLILAVLSIYATIYADHRIFFILILIINMLITRELVALLKNNEHLLTTIPIYVSAVVIIHLIFFKLYLILVAYLFLLFVTLFIIKMVSKNPIKDAFVDISVTFVASIMLPLCLSTIFLIRDISYQWLIYLYFVVWCSDVFAYFVGVKFGKHRLIEAVSPKKSIEGLIGGTVFALIAGLIINHYLLDKSIIWMTLMTLEVIAIGVIGDLIESMIKRSANVKDSGTLIPGHGGMYDRFDSMIFAAPLLFLYINILDTYIKVW